MRDTETLLKGFLKQAGEQMRGLAGALAEGDFEAAAKLAHVLANTFVAVRNKDGMRRAYAVEKAAGRKSVPETDACMASLATELDLAIDDVNRRLARLESETSRA